VHKQPPALRLAPDFESSQPTIRRAKLTDVKEISELVNGYAAQGSMLPRSMGDIAARLDNYVVASDDGGRVIACAALEEYSPSLAEVSSVAVAPSEHGKGLGTQVVRGIERLARSRDIEELFALSLTGNFFLSMGYELTAIARYPEKLTRYDSLRESGVAIVPKPCFTKRLETIWAIPQLVEVETRQARIA
jgi:amino-acid N-acetyltransferase